ncbi:hypothetical protein pb186bvf_002365 [Paramecium bursaria]
MILQILQLIGKIYYDMIKKFNFLKINSFRLFDKQKQICISFIYFKLRKRFEYVGEKEKMIMIYPSLYLTGEFCKLCINYNNYSNKSQTLTQKQNNSYKNYKIIK